MWAEKKTSVLSTTDEWFSLFHFGRQPSLSHSFSLIHSLLFYSISLSFRRSFCRTLRNKIDLCSVAFIFKCFDAIKCKVLHDPFSKLYNHLSFAITTDALVPQPMLCALLHSFSTMPLFSLSFRFTVFIRSFIRSLFVMSPFLISFVLLLCLSFLLQNTLETELHRYQCSLISNYRFELNGLKN